MSFAKINSNLSQFLPFYGLHLLGEAVYTTKKLLAINFYIMKYCLTQT